MGWLRIGPIVLVLVLVATPDLDRADGPNQIEKDVVSLVNSAREAAGLPPLALHADLVRAARIQTLRMAIAGSLFHTEGARLQEVTPWWTRLAENVGMGPSVERIHATFLRAVDAEGFRADAFADYLARMDRFLAPVRPITLADLEGKGLGRLVDRYVKRDGDRVRIVTYLYPTDPRWKRMAPPGLVEAIAGADPGITVTGTNVVSQELRGLFKRDASRAVLLGLVLVAALLWIDFRSVRLTAIALAQLLAGVALMLGCMRLLNLPINYANAFVATIAGALRVPGDRVVYPPAAACVLLEGAKRRGVEVSTGLHVERIEPGRVRCCGGRTLEADVVVNAAGPEATRLLPGLPIAPRKGHLVITDRYPGFLRHQVIELGYLKSAHTLTPESVACNVQPRKTGQLLIGSSRELVGWDRTIN